MNRNLNFFALELRPHCRRANITSTIDTLRTALHFRDTPNYPAIVALCDAASIDSLFLDYRENVRPLSRADLQLRHPQQSDAQIALAEQFVPHAQAGRDKQIAFRLPETSGYAELEQLSANEFLRAILPAGATVDGCSFVRGSQRIARFRTGWSSHLRVSDMRSPLSRRRTRVQCGSATGKFGKPMVGPTDGRP